MGPGAVLAQRLQDRLPVGQFEEGDGRDQGVVSRGVIPADGHDQSSAFFRLSSARSIQRQIEEAMPDPDTTVWSADLQRYA